MSQRQNIEWVRGLRTDEVLLAAARGPMRAPMPLAHDVDLGTIAAHAVFPGNDIERAAVAGIQCLIGTSGARSEAVSMVAVTASPGLNDLLIEADTAVARVLLDVDPPTEQPFRRRATPGFLALVAGGGDGLWVRATFGGRQAQAPPNRSACSWLTTVLSLALDAAVALRMTGSPLRGGVELGRAVASVFAEVELEIDRKHAAAAVAPGGAN